MSSTITLAAQAIPAGITDPDSFEAWISEQGKAIATIAETVEAETVPPAKAHIIARRSESSTALVQYVEIDGSDAEPLRFPLANGSRIYFREKTD